MTQDRAGRPASHRFGVFELDLRSGELRRSGIRVPLQEQPCRVLARLLSTPGELVTRDDLRRELWATDTFVDFEHSLTVAIKRLRDALGDSAETPRFIETLPRRGYRFIAPVAQSPTPQPPPVVRPLVMGLSAMAVIVTAGIVGAVFARRPAPGAAVPPQKVFIADFLNRTHDETFDGTLRQALTVALEQSPSLAVVSRERVHDVLRQMQQLDAPLVDAVALEACQRAGATAAVRGTLSSLGRRYAVTLEALDCISHEALATEQAQADRPEDVVDALGKAAARFRARLGESAATVAQFDRPLREATTSSMDALKAYSLAEDTRDRAGELASEPFYERALEHDPEFVMAYARLSAIYANTDRGTEMIRATREAYARRERVTEHERMYIDLRSCAGGLSPDPDCMLHVGQLWQRLYPLDWNGHYAIGYWQWQRGGDFAAAAENAETALRLNPDNVLP